MDLWETKWYYWDYRISSFECQLSNECLISNEGRVKSDCFPNVLLKKWVSNQRWGTEDFEINEHWGVHLAKYRTLNKFMKQNPENIVHHGVKMTKLVNGGFEGGGGGGI